MVKLAVVGAKNSGKTTVMEGLIRYLTGRGYRVATLKHTSHVHRFDTPGKDSYRHRDAGAGVAIAVNPEEVAVFSQPGSLDIEQIETLIESKFDILLIEGYHLADYPKVLVTRQTKDFVRPLPNNIIATIGSEPLKDLSAHFEETDYEGLGEFVTHTMPVDKSERSK
jgi:molybdopterin-guanine dinucleotide biosynthesis protein B